MASITLEGLTKVFPDGTVAVSDLNLGIEDGEFMVLVGPSGCGKTTALRMVAGLEEISSGVVRIGPRVVNKLSPKDRDVAMVFQNYALYPHLTVFNNMAFSLKLKKADKAEIKRRVKEAAQILGLDQLLDRKPRNLSGGQRQRVAMGRAIVREPQAFLMDEPLSNLDAKLRVQMRAEISRIQSHLGVTTIYVTHDQVEAMTLGNRVAVIKKGILQQVAGPQELYEHPVNIFVAGFIGSPAMNMAEAKLSAFDGDLKVSFGGHDLRVPAAVVDHRPALRSFVGRNVVLGIRPEDMEDASLVPQAPADQKLAAKVSLLEALGSEVLVHFEVEAPVVLTEDVKELAVDVGAEHLENLEKQARVGRSVFTASLNPKTTAQKGGSIELVADSTRFHFFDPDTGLGIYH
ncbi:MAG: sn-glycerol-3-phosphate ABC transporter ATP-binding protein UgpC [Actinobacteria bacterium]|nr:sn-glycerol-3-phosphate ABC transporter ATP-binding protein UgpC [Actinomycetota bacterium]